MMDSERLFDEKKPLRVADQGCFFVGGGYVEEGDGRTMQGQMFVQYQIPAKRRFPRCGGSPWWSTTGRARA